MNAPESIYNWRRLDARLSTSGQPSEAQLAALAASGVGHVINLAPLVKLNMLVSIFVESKKRRNALAKTLGSRGAIVKVRSFNSAMQNRKSRAAAG